LKVNKKKSYNFASAGNECLSEAYRILHCYVRFMFKKYKLGRLNRDVFHYCPHYIKYSDHLTAGIIIARQASLNGEIEIFYTSSGCNEIDILLKKFLRKNYRINLSFVKNFKQNNRNYYKPFKVNFFKSVKDIIFDLRAYNGGNIKKLNNNSNSFDVLLLTHPYSKLENLGPYNYLTKKLSNFFQENNLIARNIIPSQIGLSIFDKLFGSFQIFLKILSILVNYKYLTFSNINFIISASYRKIYKTKLKKFLSTKKIKFLIASYIDMKYEPIYYEAANELGIKYFLYDFSVGYPLKDFRFLRYVPDVRKFADVIFFNSIFRMEQYSRALSFKNIKMEILPHACPQIDFSVSRRKNIIDNKQFKIGIVDNMFSEDLILNYEDLFSFSKELQKIDINIGLILQSKRGELTNIIEKLKLSYLYKNFQKGDLSNLKDVNLIVSIGWQGAALKAAFAFKKPIIFYSKNSYPYEEHTFSFDKNKNLAINTLSRSLWFDQKYLKEKLNKLIIDKKSFEITKKSSLMLLDEIGFIEGNIDEYFSKYFI
tara:strand:- start:2879 stop:4498 length:1620 start_codon:yes stop_codon:yes gene_type:complete